MRSPGLLALVALLLAPGQALAARCDRACLNAAVDRYLAAVVAHDPAKAGLAAKVRFTENSEPIPIGDGLWATATGLGSYKIYVDDPEAGEVGFVGTVLEHGKPDILALRLAVPNGRISEIESIVVRDARAVGNLVTPRPAFAEVLDPGERRPRDEMIRISNSYFNAIQAGDGTLAPFDPSCDRLENGLQTTHNPTLTMLKVDSGDAEHPAPNYGAMGCSEQISTGIYSFITRIEPRRVAVVDHETGVTFGIYMFQHRGATTYFDLPGKGRIENPFGGRPSDVLMAELFKIRDARIMAVEAVGTMLPYGARTGWE